MKDKYLLIHRPEDLGVGPEPTLSLVECTDEEYADYMDFLPSGEIAWLIPVDDVKKVLSVKPQPLRKE